MGVLVRGHPIEKLPSHSGDGVHSVRRRCRNTPSGAGHQNARPSQYEWEPVVRGTSTQPFRMARAPGCSRVLTPARPVAWRRRGRRCGVRGGRPSCVAAVRAVGPTRSRTWNGRLPRSPAGALEIRAVPGPSRGVPASARLFALVSRHAARAPPADEERLPELQSQEARLLLNVSATRHPAEHDGIHGSRRWRARAGRGWRPHHAGTPPGYAQGCQGRASWRQDGRRRPERDPVRLINPGRGRRSPSPPGPGTVPGPAAGPPGPGRRGRRRGRGACRG